MTAWFAVRVVLDARASGVRALAGGHCALHLVHSAAMLYTPVDQRAVQGQGACRSSRGLPHVRPGAAAG